MRISQVIQNQKEGWTEIDVEIYILASPDHPCRFKICAKSKKHLGELIIPYKSPISTNTSVISKHDVEIRSYHPIAITSPCETLEISKEEYDQIKSFIDSYPFSLPSDTKIPEIKSRSVINPIMELKVED